MKNRIAITGASSEIGLAVCDSLANSEDHFILQCFNNRDRLLAWKEKGNVSCEIIAADFNGEVALKGFCQSLSDIDILINLAGVTKTALLPMLSEDDIAATLNVNIRALSLICRSVLPAMLSRRRGCIINMSSIVAKRAMKGQSIYAGSKGFVDAFSRALAAEYGGRGIRVNCVAPGSIEAGSLREVLEYAPEEVKRSNVSGKTGQPADVAAAVAFLCSEKASYINGTVLAVDGGFCVGV